MIETLKHTLYAGIGATVVTAEKIEHALQDLVERGRLSSEEARETARKVAEESKKEYQQARTELQDLFDDMIAKAPVASRKELDRIKARLDALEKKMDELKPADS